MLLYDSIIVELVQVCPFWILTGFSGAYIRGFYKEISIHAYGQILRKVCEVDDRDRGGNGPRAHRTYGV